MGARHAIINGKMKETKVGRGLAAHGLGGELCSSGLPGPPDLYPAIKFGRLGQPRAYEAGQNPQDGNPGLGTVCGSSTKEDSAARRRHAKMAPGPML
ncbi:hypothetical protein NDU88_000194 [Pleurodeles waltl]|uniref:Uncharacterized protein n=1 Tax=Pleurodeles waltl TaxID=8319 RepID=A0AAV7TE98_PLEWA|nr:hypothetical protein NDU88_000194 [Pleurodeles waltl]